MNSHSHTNPSIRSLTAVPQQQFGYLPGCQSCQAKGSHGNIHFAILVYVVGVNQSRLLQIRTAFTWGKTHITSDHCHSVTVKRDGFCQKQCWKCKGRGRSCMLIHDLETWLIKIRWYCTLSERTGIFHFTFSQLHHHLQQEIIYSKLVVSTCKSGKFFFKDLSDITFCVSMRG